MITQSTDDKASEIPSILIDVQGQCQYERLRFFGEGKFGKFFEVRNMHTNYICAIKILSKDLIQKNNLGDQVSREINIHKTLTDKNVVRFLNSFNDTHNIYIILELCKQYSMKELHEKRPNITEYECRFHMHQILRGLRYLHDNRIIHRDLKLSNLFLDDELNVKIGDFGLSTRLENLRERKKSVCGTPNFIAPEIINESGHSYEVDIWSIGCVMYTLLVGTPPFKTDILKETIAKIRRCDYTLPSFINHLPAAMISEMIQWDPSKRPSVHKCIEHTFLTNYEIPSPLPLSCLTCAPLLDESNTKELVKLLES